MKIIIQHESKLKHIPPNKNIIHWAKKTLGTKKAEITLRIVNKKESAYLNESYRPNKSGPTNVLSFVYSKKPIIGDIVLCAPLIPDEKTWQHLIVHGVLHLMGYDHIKNKDAKIMENLEAKILRKLYG